MNGMKINDTRYHKICPKQAHYYNNIVLVMLLSVCQPWAGAAEQPPDEATVTVAPVSDPLASGHARPASQRAAGMVIFVDPQTGETKEPPASALEELTLEHPESLSSAWSTPAAGLAEIPSPTPNGGVMVRLQGRFLSPLSIIRHPDGQLTIQHRQEPLASEPAK